MSLLLYISLIPRLSCRENKLPENELTVHGVHCWHLCESSLPLHGHFVGSEVYFLWLICGMGSLCDNFHSQWPTKILYPLDFCSLFPMVT